MTNAERILAHFIVNYRTYGFTVEAGIAEAKRVASCATERDYFRFKRVGSTVALNRADRRDIWGLWENAQNHASVEDEIKTVEV